MKRPQETIHSKTLSPLVLFVNLLLMFGMSEVWARFEVIDTIPIEVDGVPTDASLLAISPDGTRLYGLDSFGNRDLRLLVVDIPSKTVVDVIPLGKHGNVHSTAITPDGTKIYIPIGNIGSGASVPGSPPRVEVIDTLLSSLAATILVGPNSGNNRFGPTVAAVTPDATQVYVTHHGASVVRVIDTLTDTLAANVPTGLSVSELIGIAITPDGTRAYAAHRGNQLTYVIDTDPASPTYNTVIKTIHRSFDGAFSRTEVAASPDGKSIYTTQDDASKVSVIDSNRGSPTFHTEIGTIQTSSPKLSFGLVVSMDSRIVLAASPQTREIVVLDTDPASPTYHTQIDSIDFVNSPGDLIRSHDGLFYTSVPADHLIAVIGESADEADNCPDNPNPDQADLDGDGAGDVCDPDDDNDGVVDDTDNCPVDANFDQADLDGDGAGDVCDPDDDNDGVTDDVDNCPVDANPDQADLDGDGAGDVCDPDDDNDGVVDDADNCPVAANPDQADFDADGLGDVCDPDDDNDGVTDADDECPMSKKDPTVLVGSCDSGVQNDLLFNGCTVSDLIAQCDGTSLASFCVVNLLKALVSGGTISVTESLKIRACL